MVEKGREKHCHACGWWVGEVGDTSAARGFVHSSQHSAAAHDACRPHDRDASRPRDKQQCRSTPTGASTHLVRQRRGAQVLREHAQARVRGCRGVKRGKPPLRQGRWSDWRQARSGREAGSKTHRPLQRSEMRLSAAGSDCRRRQHSVAALQAAPSSPAPLQSCTHRS